MPHRYRGFLANLELSRRGSDECWPWAGRIEKTTGYGTNGREQAHRAVYRRLVGDIPVGLELDHLCRNRPCVNPAHLEPVTTGENQRRGYGPSGIAYRRSACSHGHPHNAENTYMYTEKKSGRTWRICRTCRRAGLRRFKERRQAAAT